MAALGQIRATFTATGGAGVYATENWPIGFGPGNTLAGFNANATFQPMKIDFVTAVIDNLGSSTGQMELWVPVPGCQDYTQIANYTLWHTVNGVWSAANAGTTIQLASYPGALMRFKASAVAGNPTAYISYSGPGKGGA